MVSPELLRRFAFFGGLTDDELRAIAMITDEVAFPAHVDLFQQGQDARRLYVLIEGNLDLFYSRPTESGVVDAHVGTVAQGEVFGVAALVEPFRLSATARSGSPTRSLAIHAPGLRALCEVDCRVGYTLMRHIAVAQAERLDYARIQLAACTPG